MRFIIIFTRNLALQKCFHFLLFHLTFSIETVGSFIKAKVNDLNKFNFSSLFHLFIGIKFNFDLWNRANLFNDSLKQTEQEQGVDKREMNY